MPKNALNIATPSLDVGQLNGPTKGVGEGPTGVAVVVGIGVAVGFGVTVNVGEAVGLAVNCEVAVGVGVVVGTGVAVVPLQAT